MPEESVLEGLFPRHPSVVGKQLASLQCCQYLLEHQYLHTNPFPLLLMQRSDHVYSQVQLETASKMSAPITMVDTLLSIVQNIN